MVEVNEQVEISAPVNRVWQVLTDFPSYKRWVPYISRISPQPGEPGILMITVNTPGVIPLKIKTRILTCLENENLSLQVNFMNLPVLAKGVMSFIIHTTDDQTIRLDLRFSVKGLLSGFISGEMIDGARKALAEINQRLKQLAEEGCKE